MKQPPHKIAFTMIFFTEMWERFSQFGLRSLFVLYSVHALNWSDSKAYTLFGTYICLLCLAPAIGGYLADRYLGHRNAVLYGGVAIFAGHTLMAMMPDAMFTYSLSCIILGSGLMIPALTSLVGLIYENDKIQRDRAYNFYYMAINIGGILAGITVGIVAHYYGWHTGFALAAIGMFLALLAFAVGWVFIEQCLVDYTPSPRLSIPVLAMISGSLTLIIYLFGNQMYMPWIVLAIGLAAAFNLTHIHQKLDTAAAKKSIKLLAILFGLSICYFIMYEQSGTSITMFTERVINRRILGFTIPTPVLSSLNPCFIILFAPLMATLWRKLQQQNIQLNTIAKVAIGILVTSSGFMLLALAGQSAHPGLIWLSFAVMLLTLGELFVGPVILAAISELAPKQHTSTFMGMWFMMGAISSYLAATLAKLTSIGAHQAHLNQHYGHIFKMVGTNGLLLGILVLAILRIPRFKLAAAS